MSRPLPDLDEDVEPIEDDVGHLSGKAEVLKKVGCIGKVFLSCVVLAQFVVDKVLKKSTRK